MTADALLYEVFELLYEKHVKGAEQTPGMFVGLHDDKIVVVQPGGEHFAILIVPATVGAKL